MLSSVCLQLVLMLDLFCSIEDVRTENIFECT